MTILESAISIHPYFRVQEGQMDACKSFLEKFNQRVVNESNCLYYNFTFQGDILFCREAYANAEAVQEHLQNCGDLLGEFLKIADVIRIELHGPAEELEKLKATFEDMNPEYYELSCGIGR